MTNLVLKPLNIAISTAIIVSAVALTACGSDTDNTTGNSTTDTNTDSDTNTDTVTVPDAKPVPQPDPVKQELGNYSLVKAQSDDKFLDYYSVALNNLNSEPLLEETVDGSAPTPEADKATDGNSGIKQSGTNLIEAGVDEVDYVKQNATHIYTTKQRYGDKSNDTIYVYDKPSTEPVAKLDLGKSQGFKGFFLKDESLYNFSQLSYGGHNWDNDSKAQNYKNGVIALQTVDIANPAKPDIVKTYNWQGDYVNSRRIDDKVYVVSSSQLNDPWMCYDVMPEPGNLMAADVERVMPYCGEPKTLTKQDIIERMPININGVKVSPSDCFIPNEYDKKSENLTLNITLITEVDLTNSDNNKTTCIAASAESFYMSSNALYLAGRDYTDSVTGKGYEDKTVFSKFGLGSGSVNYAGSGAVAGHINWGTASFSMSEYDDVLRVVTSTWREGQAYNMLHTLKESATKLTLDTLATLPNESQPASIGKPNERIKGIRFMGPEGYVVTFETRDPLYKIDLSDPSNPKIAGELDMPGYSAYLQRINDKYLLGVGYSTNDDNRPDGLQVTVFDTSGNDPIIVDQDIIKTSDSGFIELAVANDSRAITTLIDANTLQLSIPYIVYNYNADSQFANKAVEYNIDLTTGIMSDKVERHNTVVNPIYGEGVLRSLISDDDIYYSKADGGLNRYTWGVQ